MARRLRDRLVALTLDPDDLQLRDGQESPTRRPSADDVVWLLQTSGASSADPSRESWADRWGAEHAAKAMLPRTGGRYVLDDEADGPRVVRTAHLRASGVRAWRRIEFLEHVPDDTAIAYRVSNGTAELAWDGAAWTAQVDDAGAWNDPDVINVHLDELPTSTRAIAVVAKLSTTTPSASPAFFGARIAFGTIDRGEEEDALHRALLARMMAEITSSAEFETVLPDGLAAPASVELFPGATIAIASLDGVWDVTTGPDDAPELDGTFTAGAAGAPGQSATWSPAEDLAADTVLRFEVSTRPELVISQHRDLAQLSSLPCVRIYPNTETEKAEAQPSQPLRPRAWGAWGALDPGGSARIKLVLQLVAVAELGGQARSLASALGDFLGSSGYRSLLSQETGRIVTVRSNGAMVSEPSALAQGITEVRGTWILEYEARRGRQFTTSPIVRPGGVTFSTE